MLSILHRLHLCLSKATNSLQSVAQCQTRCGVKTGSVLASAQHGFMATGPLVLWTRSTPAALQVMTDVIQKGSPQVQLRAMDVLLSALQHNPPQLRAFMLQQRDHTLFTSLIT